MTRHDLTLEHRPGGATLVSLALACITCIIATGCDPTDAPADDAAPGEVDDGEVAGGDGDPLGMDPDAFDLTSPDYTAAGPVKAPLAQAFCQINVEGVVRATETDYLPRVIACENGGADFEALKAQAVAARSVAYYNMATSGTICDGQGCQVYSCGIQPSQIHHDAVAATSGQYLHYNGWLTYGFYVAGDSSMPASCIDTDDGVGGTEHYVTFNNGKTHYAVDQTSLGFKYPEDTGVAGYGQNRGCMSQWGARCLEATKGFDSTQILRFYYGADIGIGTAPGACVVGPPEPPPPPPPPRRLTSSNNRDYNGDGKDDIFWYAPGEHADPLWLGASGHAFTESFAPNVQSLYFTIAGDYNGDGNSDVFFYAPGELPEAVWNGTDAGSFTKSVPRNAGGGTFDVSGSYTPIGGDFNGDGLDDIFWYAPGAAEDSLWYGLGGNKFKNVPVSVDGKYLPVGGDFDGDGRSDILWYGGVNLPESVWYGRNNTTATFDQLTTSNVAGLYLPFAGDFNGDGRDDIFWYAPGDAPDQLWSGTAARSFTHGQPLKPGGGAWNIQGDFEAIPGDFNGDGRFDILWYGRGSNPDSIFYATSNGRFESDTVAISGVYAPV